MKKEEALKVLESANRYAEKLEDVLRCELGVTAHLRFEMKEASCGYYVTGLDAGSDVNRQMTNTPLLRQLFKEAWLRLDVWDSVAEVVFGIGIVYSHNYNGGSNGHDLMAVGIKKETGEVRVRK